jgi:segregation and condensation protein B
MAFNLKKVLRALLFSTSQPLSVKDIQAAFTRFHEQAVLPVVEGEESTPPPPATDAPATPGEGAPAVLTAPSEVAPVSAPVAAEAAGPVNPLGFAPEDPELYAEVPSLITATQIREAMDEISLELRASDTGLLLIEGNDGYRLVTHPSVARWVRVLRNEPPPVKLSQSALETLAVVAYRQPATRTELEHIRGVSAEAGLNKLLERELIYIVGRADLPGRPLQYGTTDKFFEFLGIKSLEELPASDVLSNRQIDEWLQNSSNARPPTDVDMGLPLELGEGTSPNFDQVTIQQDDEAAVGHAVVVPSAPLPDQPIPATAAIADPASPAPLPEAVPPSPPADEKAAAS